MNEHTFNHFPFSGHGQFEAYIEAGGPVAETNEGMLCDPEGLVGDVLCGVNDHKTRYHQEVPLHGII